jgi:hypothetical protein
VVENHRNILYHIMAYTNAIHICADDRLTLLHSLSFQAAEFHLFGALLNARLSFHLTCTRRELEIWGHGSTTKASPFIIRSRWSSGKPNSPRR